MTGHQLALDLGRIASTPAPEAADTIDLTVVVCHLCTARHPVERCPRRVAICDLCTGPHPTAHHRLAP